MNQTGTYRIAVLSYAGAGPFFLDASAGTAGDAPADRPPVVSISAPAEDASVSGTVRVQVVAGDDIGVSKVELAVDAGDWQDITAAFDGTFYAYAWDTATVADGPHTLGVRATDTAGQVTTAGRRVTVRNQNRVYEKAMAGTVSPDGADAVFTVDVGAPGFVDFRLDWATLADLDFFVFAPNGALVGQAYTLRRPESLRVDTERFGTGVYQVRVSGFSGPESPFILTARGHALSAYSGTVSPSQRDAVHRRNIPFTGPSRLVLAWSAGADLDFFVQNGAGVEKGRGYTILNPETLNLTLDSTGEWQVRVNLFIGPPIGYTLKWYAPEAILQ